MWGILLVALIIYAVVQHRKRKRLRWLKWGDREWSKWSHRDWSKHDWSKFDWSKQDWSKWKTDAKASATASAERFASDLHSKIKREFDSKMARKFEAKAERFERRLRARFDKQTQKYSGVSLDPAHDLPPPPQFKSDAERQSVAEFTGKVIAALAGPDEVAAGENRLSPDGIKSYFFDKTTGQKIVVDGGLTSAPVIRVKENLAPPVGYIQRYDKLMKSSYRPIRTA